MSAKYAALIGAHGRIAFENKRAFKMNIFQTKEINQLGWLLTLGEILKLVMNRNNWILTYIIGMAWNSWRPSVTFFFNKHQRNTILQWCTIEPDVSYQKLLQVLETGLWRSAGIKPKQTRLINVRVHTFKVYDAEVMYLYLINKISQIGLAMVDPFFEPFVRLSTNKECKILCWMDISVSAGHF